MSEARVFAEGALRYVEASGSGTAWQTASAAHTGLVSYVQAGFTVNSARKVATIMERGYPSHHKIIGAEAVTTQFTYLLSNVAGMLPYTATADGASVPLYHLELKSDADEGDATAVWTQFVRGVLVSRNITEAEEGNTVQENWAFISQSGPTGSGYIA
jgi:tetrahydromethanopterin S-methyltransferase subunit D